MGFSKKSAVVGTTIAAALLIVAFADYYIAELAFADYIAAFSAHSAKEFAAPAATKDAETSARVYDLLPATVGEKIRIISKVSEVNCQ